MGVVGAQRREILASVVRFEQNTKERTCERSEYIEKTSVFAWGNRTNKSRVAGKEIR